MRNSTKFTFKGYIQLCVKPASLKIVKNNMHIKTIDAVMFEIYDTGIGISDENQ